MSGGWKELKIKNEDSSPHRRSFMVRVVRKSSKIEPRLVSIKDALRGVLSFQLWPLCWKPYWRGFCISISLFSWCFSKKKCFAPFFQRWNHPSVATKSCFPNFLAHVKLAWAIQSGIFFSNFHETFLESDFHEFIFTSSFSSSINTLIFQ